MIGDIVLSIDGVVLQSAKHACACIVQAGSADITLVLIGTEPGTVSCSF